MIPVLSSAWARHFPWATIGLIAANLAVALLLGFPGGSAAPIDGWVLRYGRIDPITWITSAFTHLDWFHVGGNMIFLWAFGFLVEGRLGWRRFLALYLVLAAAASALMQLIMLHRDFGGAAGASAAITGLMATAALWTPRDRLKVLIVLLPLVRICEMSVLTFCAISIAIDAVLVFLFGSVAGGALAHVLGGGVGVAVAYAMLRWRWVDTEGDDLFAPRRPRRPAPPRVPDDPRVAAVIGIQDALRTGDAVRANELCRAAAARLPGWRPSRGVLAALVEGLVAAGRRDLALPRMEQLLAGHAADSASLRLKVARELVRAGRPGRATEHLARLDEARLTAPQRDLRDRLAREARALQAQGRLELE